MSKLVGIKTYERFRSLWENNDIDEFSLNFIIDTGQLYTHGIFINGAVFGTAANDAVPLSIAGITNTLALSSHTHSNYLEKDADIDISNYKIKSGDKDLLLYSGGSLYLGNDTSPTYISGSNLYSVRGNTVHEILDTSNFSISNTLPTGYTYNNTAYIRYGSNSHQIDYVKRINTSLSFDYLNTYTLAGTNILNGILYGYITLYTDNVYTNPSWAQLRINIPNKVMLFRTSADPNNWIGFDAPTIPNNALNVAGIVAAPSSTTINKVWKTDGSGNPAWRDEMSYTFSNLKFQQISGTDLMTYNTLATKTILAGSNISFTHDNGVLTIKAQDTTYGVVSKTSAGLTPQLPNETTTTKFLRQDGTWATPTYTSDTNTWRPIKVNGTEKRGTAITSGDLNFINGSNTTVEWTSDNKLKINSTWTAWKGATDSANGTAGYMPAPTSALRGQFLRGDGSWVSLNNYSLPTASNTTLGGVKTGAAITDTSGYTAVAIKDGVIYYKDTNTTYSFSNLLFQNSGGTTVDTYKPTTSPTKTLKAGANVTISASSNIITIASTNTWNANAVGVAGYVAAPTKAANANMTWQTDAEGVPAWRASNNHSHNRITSLGNKNASDLSSTYPSGLSVAGIYNNGYPFAHGSTITANGNGGHFQIAGQWNSSVTGNDNYDFPTEMYIRGRRDSYDVWTTWTRVLTNRNWSSVITLPTKASWNYDDRYVTSVSISGNNLRINKNGANTDLTIPYATKAVQDNDGTALKGNYLRKVLVADNTANDFNTFESMTLTGRGDPTTGASLLHAPWTGGGPAGGYGVLTYLWSDYGIQMAWGYVNNHIYIRNKYYNSGVIWADSWSTVALTSDITKSAVGLGNVANYDQSKAIKSITRSGTTFTYTTLDGTTGTFTLQDSNTTYNFSGTTFYSGNSGTAEHNCNNAVKNGNYYYTSNGPSGLGNSTSGGALYVQSYSDSWVGQIAQDYRNGRLFVRGKNNGTWQSWVRIANYNEIPSSLPANGGNADTVDGQHFKWSNDSNSPTYLWAANSSGTAFLCARGSMSVNYANYSGYAGYLTLTYCNSSTNSGLWNTIKNGSSNTVTNKVNFYTIYNNGGPTTYGEMLEILSYNANYWLPLLWFGAGRGGHMYYRNKDYNNNTWGDWLTILDSSNSSVSKSGETLTVKINGTSQSLTNTNTWRGILNNLTSTSTTDSLSAAQGKALNDKFANYHPLNGKITMGGGSYFWYNIQQYNSSNANPSYYNASCAIININSYKGWQPWIRCVDSENGSWALGQYTNFVTLIRYVKTNTGNEQGTYNWTFNADGSLTASKFIGTLQGNCTGSAGSVAWANVTGKPLTFAPSSHTHDYLPLSGGSLTGLLSVRNTGNTAEGQYNQGAMLIREYNYGGSLSDTWGNAPRLTWHWSGRVAAQIGLGSNGYLYEAPATGTNFYRLVYESGTWGINVTGSAGSVAWSNVSGRPTNLNLFTNGPGYITSSGSCSYATTAGTANSVAFNNIASNPFIYLFISPNQTRGTGINVNAREGGRTLLILMSGQCASGNDTASRIYMVRCGYSGNNYNFDELHSLTGTCSVSLTASVSSSGELLLKANSGLCCVAIYLSRFD